MHRKIGSTSDHLLRSQSGDIQDDFINYNTVPFDVDDSDYDNGTAHRENVISGSRRWSILEKLERR